MTETIHVDQFLPHPPEKVWLMLTEPDRLATWWAAGDIRATVGHTFTVDMGGFGHQPCTVTEVDEQRLLAYTFAEDSMGWTLTWRLVAEGTGTRLFLEHGGFDLSDPAHATAYENMSRGWVGVLARLGRELSDAGSRTAG